MPYGNTRYSTPYRRSRFTRRAPPTLPRAPKKVPTRPRRTLTRRKPPARTAYTRLARQVYQLKQRQYGQVQKNVHETSTPIQPSQTMPVLFNLTNAQVEAAYYKPATMPHLHANAGYFIRPTGLGAFWNQSQDDIISGRHKLMYSSYDFKIDFMKQNFNQTVRIDTFVMRKAFPQYHTNMPQEIAQLQDMTGSNLFNKSFFKLYSTKYVTCPANDDKSIDEPTVQQAQSDPFGNPITQVGTGILITKHLHLKFKHNRVITPARDLTEMEEIALSGDGDSELNNLNTVPGPNSGQAVIAAVETYSHVGQDPRKIYWMLVSSNSDEASAFKPSIKITRQVWWRDDEGHAA